MSPRSQERDERFFEIVAWVAWQLRRMAVEELIAHVEHEHAIGVMVDLGHDVAR
jgi:hypothetical protein